MTPNPGSVLCPKCGRRSALEALVGLAVVKQVADQIFPSRCNLPVDLARIRSMCSLGLRRPTANFFIGRPVGMVLTGAAAVDSLGDEGYAQ